MSAATTSTAAAVQACIPKAQRASHVTTAELHHALDTMPAYTREYTSCQDVLTRALLTATRSHGGGPGSSSGSAFLPAPVIVVLAVLVVVALALGGLAVRRRRAAA